MGGARGGAHPLVAVWQGVVQGGGRPLHQDADGLPQQRHHAEDTGVKGQVSVTVHFQQTAAQQKGFWEI